MLVTLIRAAVLYVLIIFCMRIMGKRQLGELQPTELVITILLSEIAAVPMQDNALPLGNSIVAVLLLVALEIINSVIVLKSSRCRSLLQGNSLVVIRDGVVVYEGSLASLRRFKDDVKEVRAGYESAFVFESYNDVKEGDVVEAFKMVEVAR